MGEGEEGEDQVTFSGNFMPPRFGADAKPKTWPPTCATCKSKPSYTYAAYHGYICRECDGDGDPED